MADVAIRRRTPRSLNLKYQPGFGTLAILCLIMLYAPIVVLIVFSFNDNRSVAVWTEFSTDWYVSAFHNEEIRAAAWISLKLALVATVVSTVFATAAALATTRTRAYRGMTAAYLVINQPLVVPEIITAIATLSFFALLRTEAGIYFGFGNLILAHTVFCIPFAYMPIRARLEDMDLTLEQAAADLYATPWKTFQRITLPLLIPGIAAGAMLAFIVSFDDVIITAFVAGPGETTLPIYIFGAIRRGVTPEINAISTIVLAVSVLFVTVFYFVSRRGRDARH
jgi:spermidine/putrescine transport system permease protein